MSVAPRLTEPLHDVAPKDRFTSTESVRMVVERLGMLNAEAAERVAELQSRSGGSFGRTAVKMGLMSRHDLQIALGVRLGFLRDNGDCSPLPSSLTVAQNPYSREAEAFRRLRARMLTGLAPEALNGLCITGVNRSAGASYVAANLAVSFAQLGRSVLLVDADLTRASAHSIFSVERGCGVADVVAGDMGFDEARRATRIVGLDVLTAGNETCEPQLVLGDRAFRALIDGVCRHYEIVLVLTSAADETDGVYAWSAVGRVLVAARKDETRLRAVADLHSTLRTVDATTVGAVMTE